MIKSINLTNESEAVLDEADKRDEADDVARPLIGSGRQSCNGILLVRGRTE